MTQKEIDSIKVGDVIFDIEKNKGYRICKIGNGYVEYNEGVLWNGSLTKYSLLSWNFVSLMREREDVNNMEDRMKVTYTDINPDEYETVENGNATELRRKKGVESNVDTDDKKKNPELTESDDERIRKDIIRFLEVEKEDRDATFFDAAIAYLEKQKETENVFDLKSYKKGYNEGYQFGYEVGYGVNQKEKRKEQEPVETPINWTELSWKDIIILEEIINNVHYEFRNGIGQESFGKEVLEEFRNRKDGSEVDSYNQNNE